MIADNSARLYVDHVDRSHSYDRVGDLFRKKDEAQEKYVSTGILVLEHSAMSKIGNNIN